MSRAGFWKKDWFLGLVVAVVLFLLGGSDLIQSLERKAYDIGVRATDRTPSERIAVIAIDDASIGNIGRWPWPRDVHAKLTDTLKAGGAKVVGNLVFFTEPQVDPGLAYVNRLLAEYGKAVPDPQALEPGSPLVTIGALLQEAEVALNTDRKLAQSYQAAGNVLLPMLFELGDPRGRPDKPLPEYVTRNAVVAAPGGEPFTTTANVQVPTAAIGTPSLGVGHLNDRPDVDGGKRSEPLVLQHFDRLYPVAVGDGRREEPEPRRQGHQARRGRGRARQPAHRDRRRSSRCTRTSTRTATGGPRFRWIPSSTCSPARFRATSTATRSC